MPYNVTPVEEWKKTSPQSKAVPLELPSKKTCLVQPVGMDTLMMQGVIPNGLLQIVQDAMSEAQRGKTPEIDREQLEKDLISDPSKVVEVFELADAVTLACVLEPHINPIPASEADRQDDLLYIDEIDTEDKLFIMNFAVGGTRDIEPFRQETTRDVADLQPSKNVRQSTKRTGRSGKR